MAILENETNNYYKINFNECAVIGLRVYANYSTYIETIDRTKEKERQSEWAIFGANLRGFLSNEYNELMASVQAITSDPTSVLSTTEFNKIDGEKYPELRAKQDLMNELEDCENNLSEYFYKRGQDREGYVLSETAKAKLLELGFNEEWLTDPIKISGRAEVYCGDYNGEPITHEFFYNRLKTVMNENITNC